MQSARPSTSRMPRSRASRTRRSSSAAGGNSVTRPVRAILYSVFSMARSEVVTAVRQVERLVDQREIRNDVADDGVLECRPVVPRRILRVAAVDRAVRAGLEAHDDRAAPAFDQADGAGPCGRRNDGRSMGPGWQRAEDLPCHAQRLRKFVEADGDTSEHV